LGATPARPRGLTLVLRSDEDLLEAAVARAAEVSSIPVEHVEKDFWLTECLRGLAEYADAEGLTVMLKGGTSLSKAYRLISRFSEDADMLVVFGELTKSRRDDHLKGLVAAAEARTGLAAISDAAQSDTGVTRVVTLKYPTPTGSTTVAPRVKIELHTAGGPFPHGRQVLRSLLSEHWHSIDNAGPADEYEELAGSSIEVLEPCRTLVEKLVLLHEAHTRAGGSAAARKIVTVRHYYDVWCLLGDEAVLAAVDTHGITALAHDVYTYSSAAGYEAASRPPGGFATSPAFGEEPTNAVRSAYAKAISDLVWPGAASPSLENCIRRVQELAARL